MSTVEGDAAVDWTRVGRRRRRRVIVAVCWLLAGVAVVWAGPLSDAFVPRDVLVGSVNREGFRAVALLGSVVLCAASIYGTAYLVSRPPGPVWRRVAAITLNLGTTAALLLLALPLLLIGGLAFSTEYRTIGTVDGREVIAEVGAGLGQYPLSAGVRDGWTVDFSRATGDIYTTRGPSLQGLTFSVREEPDEVVVIYRPGPREGDLEGVLHIPRHSDPASSAAIRQEAQSR